MEGASRPSVKFNEVYRLQPTLAGLPGNFTLDLLTPLGSAEWIGYAFPLRYVPAQKQKMLERLHGSNELLRGRKALMVDDDARNIYALTSLLENQEMDVISATNGRNAIDIIKNTSDLNIVLMETS